MAVMAVSHRHSIVVALLPVNRWKPFCRESGPENFCGCDWRCMRDGATPRRCTWKR